MLHLKNIETLNQTDKMLFYLFNIRTVDLCANLSSNKVNASGVAKRNASWTASLDVDKLIILLLPKVNLTRGLVYFQTWASKRNLKVCMTTQMKALDESILINYLCRWLFSCTRNLTVVTTQMKALDGGILMVQFVLLLNIFICHLFSNWETN